jgi:hypothetical protein
MGYRGSEQEKKDLRAANEALAKLSKKENDAVNLLVGNAWRQGYDSAKKSKAVA